MIRKPEWFTGDEKTFRSMLALTFAFAGMTYLYLTKVSNA